METIYENASFKRSVNKSSHCKVLQERAVTPSKATKVLLMVLCASLVLAVGSLCVLGVLYFGSVTLMRNMVSMEKPVQEEIKAKYDRLKSYLNDGEFCNISVGEWTVCRGLHYFSAEKHDWSKSRDVCISKGADLVTITSQNEQDFLVSKIKETHWIGLNDLETEGRWVWVDNQTLEETGVQIRLDAEMVEQQHEYDVKSVDLSKCSKKRLAPVSTNHKKFWKKRVSGKNVPDNWRDEDPSGENCASLGEENGNLHIWFDNSCKMQKRFICEKRY